MHSPTHISAVPAAGGCPTCKIIHARPQVQSFSAQASSSRKAFKESSELTLAMVQQPQQRFMKGQVLPRKHGRGTRGATPASDVARRRTQCPTRLPARQTVPAFFFFFFSDSRRLGSIHADAARFVPNRLRFTSNRADSAKIGLYWPYRVVSAGGRYGRKRPKHAGNGRNRP